MIVKKIVLKFLLVIFALLLAAGVFLFALGRLRADEVISQKPITVAVEEYTGTEKYVTYEEIDPDFVNAVIAVEDKRFFTRRGLDWIALARAVIENIQAGALVEGGSTISQQIAKNLYFGFQRTGIKDKVAEIFVMADLEEKYSKEELFALYASMNYYGDQYYGLSEAAKGYYGTTASDLTLAQAAMLAGLPNAPSVYQLSSGFDLAKKRQEKVLQCMYSNDFIDEEEFKKALQEDVSPVPSGQ